MRAAPPKPAAPPRLPTPAAAPQRVQADAFVKARAADAHSDEWDEVVQDDLEEAPLSSMDAAATQRAPQPAVPPPLAVPPLVATAVVVVEASAESVAPPQLPDFDDAATKVPSPFDDATAIVTPRVHELGERLEAHPEYIHRPQPARAQPRPSLVSGYDVRAPIGSFAAIIVAEPPKVLDTSGVALREQDYAGFDGERRRRRLRWFAVFLFVAIVGGLVTSTILSHT